MGLTFIDITIRPSPKSRQHRTLPVLVDTGASQTVVPGKLLRELGIEPHETMEFELADGSTIERKVGRAFIEIDGRGEYAPIVFGEKGDSDLLGVMTLELLRLFVDPLHRELHPLKQRL